MYICIYIYNPFYNRIHIALYCCPSTPKSLLCESNHFQNYLLFLVVLLVFVCVCICGCACMHVSGPEADAECLHHPPYLWGMVSHWAWSLLVWLDWLPSDLQRPICFYSSSLRVWLQVSAAFFFHSLFSKGRFELGILRVAFWRVLISCILRPLARRCWIRLKPTCFWLLAPKSITLHFPSWIPFHPFPPNFL